jgi:hypothetical protein
MTLGLSGAEVKRGERMKDESWRLEAGGWTMDKFVDGVVGPERAA